MEQQTQIPQTPPQVPPQMPQQPVQQPAPVQSEQKKKSHVWAWVLGGCLMVLILGFIAFLALGWWGVKKVKNEIQPGIDDIKGNIEKMSKEGEEWEKKSKEFRESLPNPEDVTSDFQNVQ